MRPRALAGAHRRASRPARVRAPSVAAARCRSWHDNGYILRVGFDTLIYMLLALGLNIVVGFAGLLDLGYVAFFGFGAYGYAMLASSQFDIHWPTLAILPLVTPRRSCRLPRRAALAAPARRLPRDRDALLRAALRDGHQQRRVDVAARAHPRTQRHNGPNGIANIDAFHLFGHSLESLRGYFYVALGFFVVVLGVVLSR